MTPLGGIGIDLWLRGAVDAARALLLSKRNWGLIDVLNAAHAEARGPISSTRNIHEPVVALCAEMPTARPTGRTSLGHLTFLWRGDSYIGKRSLCTADTVGFRRTILRSSISR
jgi:hypothetical protein